MFEQLHNAIHLQAVYQMALSAKAATADRAAFVTRLRRIAAAS